MYRCEFFQIQELVYPDLYKKYQNEGKLERLWLAFDDRALITLDALRTTYGPATVNDWINGGQFKESGLRPMDTSTGAELSQHKFGRAFDVKFKKVTAEKVRKDMEALNLFKQSIPEDISPDDPRWPFRFITCVEWINSDMSWFHFDTRNDISDNGGIKIVKG